MAHNCNYKAMQTYNSLNGWRNTEICFVLILEIGPTSQPTAAVVKEKVTKEKYLTNDKFRKQVVFFQSSKRGKIKLRCKNFAGCIYAVIMSF